MQKLNGEQQRAVMAKEGCYLVLAGAGSGKTSVVTARIVQLLLSGVPPSAILGLTFTNQAAEEMKERVHASTESSVIISTFHSLGAKILRETLSHLGYKQNFTIYDAEDSEKLIRQILTEMGVEAKEVDPKKIKSLISRAKNGLIEPEGEGVEKLFSSRGESSSEESYFPKIYRMYQERLRTFNAVDFDDLLFLPVKLFQEAPHVLKMFQDRWHFFLIDEYQDTNEAQYTFIKHLVSLKRNLFVVGDPDQSIYSWRGANLHNILNFKKDYPEAEVITLEQNYRSTNTILKASNALISNNQSRYKKNLWSSLGEGEKVKVFSGETDRDEARYVVSAIRHHQRKDNVSPEEIAIFYRTHAQSRVLEDIMLQERLPYRIIGGLSFYQRREIKDILAYLRLVASPSDLLSFQRTLNLHKTGIGPKSLEMLRYNAWQEGLPILEYCDAVVKGEPLQFETKLKEAQREKLGAYLRLVETIQRAGNVEEMISKALEESGYFSLLEEEPETADERKENLSELVAKAHEFSQVKESPTLELFLEEVTLKSSAEEGEEGEKTISLMTLHNAKGLEFRVAFMVGMEEDLCPHVNSKDSPTLVEEERRLCYVGMTRAKRELHLSSARMRYLFGTVRMTRPSRFLKELPSEYLVTRTTSPSYARAF